MASANSPHLVLPVDPADIESAFSELAAKIAKVRYFLPFLSCRQNTW
jgi:hypothetical protein